MADNSSAYAELDAMIAAIRRLKDAPQQVAKEAAPLIEAAVRQRVASGIDADGKAWASKKDGSKALVGVKKDISVTATGGLIVVKLTGNAAWHQRSRGRTDSRPQRKILLDAGAKIPDEIAQAVVTAGNRVLARMLGGR